MDNDCKLLVENQRAQQYSSEYKSFKKFRFLHYIANHDSLMKKTISKRIIVVELKVHYNFAHSTALYF
jgi:hypothetical protein